MSGPLVSVVVSAYNRPDFLRAAIDSVQAQTYANLEIIVQDDSTDDACQVLVATYADERILYVHNRPALGTVRNLLAGYRRATGTYFSTLNDDDLYQPTYLQTMVDALDSHDDVTVAFADHTLIDGNGVVLERETVHNSRTFGRLDLHEGTLSDVLHTALIVKAVPGMFAMYRRNAVDLNHFPDGVSSAYDYWLTYLAIRGGGGAYYTAQRLTSYRVHQASQTSSFSDPEQRLRFLRYNEFIDEQLLADEAVHPIWPPLRARLRETLAAQGIAHLRMRNSRAASAALRRSCHYGVSMKNLVGHLLCYAPEFIRGLIFRLD